MQLRKATDTVSVYRTEEVLALQGRRQDFWFGGANLAAKGGPGHAPLEILRF